MISNDFDVVEFKVFHFSVLHKVIIDLKQVLLVSFLILQSFNEILVIRNIKYYHNLVLKKKCKCHQL